MTSVDLIIIGAGPGGYETAVRAAKAGLRTVIIEKQEVGGTCLNVGCIPTKCFCRNAEILRDLSKSEEFGLSGLSFSFNFSKVIERKNQVVSTLVNGVKTLLKNPLISLIHGEAKFISAHEIHVQNTSEEQQEKDFSAENIIIATGSTTKFLPIQGNKLPKVLTSTEMLDLTEIPKRLCIIGGGVIGLEFASVFNTFGSDVTVLEFCKEILPNFDSDIAKRLKQSLKAQGIHIINQAAVNKIEDSGSSYAVGFDFKGVQQTAEADIVLMAVGRAANTDALNLADVGINFDRRGIQTDENLQTNIAGIYAIGDVNGKCQLAHAASFQGRRALNHILNKTDEIRLDIIPAAVFTNPEVASVGYTSDYCKEKAIEIKTHKSFFRANGKSLSMGETDGIVKILTDEDNHIVGCHIIGPHASDIIQEVTALINKNARLQDLNQIIHAHPTLSEIILSASEE